MAIQISQYKRPGIFINEYDNSIITSPAASGLNTLVIGFSKKGPVNSPVLLTNTNDLTSIFGNIDRSLERAGSFFHRTLTQMLNSSPVYALNLLATDDTLDQLQYQSLSTSTDKSNGPLSQNSYRKFFNTTGFWTKDTDSFLFTVAGDSDYNNVAFSLTNYSNTAISVFIFKSQVSGFDVSLTTWYGSIDLVPTYLDPNDYASDYLVDVVVVAGDWSNYKTLSVDPRWSQYFDSTGLLTGQVNNFTNDRNVNLLSYYQGLSIVPYFMDANGNNIFIESVINLDTNKTGLFCAYNIDLVETDYPTGMLDLIGNNLVNTVPTGTQSGLNFLSYQDTLTQQLPYGDVILDRPGNVWAIVAATYSSEFRGGTSTYTRTANYSEGYISGVTATASSTSTAITYTLGFNNPYTVINGVGISVNSGTSSFTVGTSSYPTLGATYSSALVLSNTGYISLVNGVLPNVNPSVLATDLVLGYSTIRISSGGTFSNFNYNNVYVNNSGYNDLLLGSDYTVSATGSSIVVTFLNTAASPVVTNYKQYRSIKYFNNIVSQLSSASSDQMTVITSASTQAKLSLANSTITNIQTSTLVNKSFRLSGLASYTDISTLGNLIFYTNDDEFVVGTTVLTTTNSVGTTASGVVARYSQFYLDYYNGNINDGDFFYTNFVDPADIADGGFDISFQVLSGLSYIVLQTQTSTNANYWPISSVVQAGDLFLVPGSVLNTGALTIQDYVNHSTLFNGNGTGSDGIYAFLLLQTVTNENLTGITTIYNLNLSHYLKMYIDSNDVLNVSFVNSSGAASPLDLGVSTLYNELEYAQYGFNLFSDYLNYKESVEVIYPTGYVSSPNKILVDATRYINIVIGDFLEAYVDNSDLQVGEVPRRLTRILTKQFYAPDNTFIEIGCDSRIAINNLGTSINPIWQTTRYKAIEEYITTYKSITLDGFQMRQASIPDGTETKQNAILNLVAAGTPLYNALVNKDAIDFRYLIDSFGLGLIPNSKQQLMDICGGRLDCFGFLNMPSMKQFASSISPSFLTNGVLDTSLIATGGNRALNSLYLYSFGTGAGTTCVGYFSPYLTINDSGRPLNLPPAMFVATTYLKKQSSNISSIVPWTVAAGVTNGKVTGFTNVETDFTNIDIVNLNQAHMNMIVYKRNRGFVIETENTAQTLYTSALSYIHVREVLIELERSLSAMLLDFQWKFNTSDVRSEIKLRADVICEQFVNKNGLYNYFNKCDDENNTPDIIDAQIGVLDTYVEPIKAMGIIVNNITILRTGAIQSGGFITS